MDQSDEKFQPGDFIVVHIAEAFELAEVIAVDTRNGSRLIALSCDTGRPFRADAQDCQRVSCQEFHPGYIRELLGEE